MRDSLDILSAYTALAAGESATLATVVRVEGSAYRLPGAKLLIDAAGRRTGSVSGGCLEADVARRGRLLDREQGSVLVRYDGNDDADAAWTYALGCNGSIDVFIERLAPNSSSDGPQRSLNLLQQCVAQRATMAVATIFAAPADSPLQCGDRLAASDAESMTPTGSQLHRQVQRDLLDCLHSGQTATITYETATGPVHALLEYLAPPRALIICGAGHDAVPLAAAGKTLGWHVTVIDRRPGYARPDRFPGADAVIAADLSNAATLGSAGIGPAPPILPGAAVVIMTHHYPDDRALLATALRSPAGYIGVLGPRTRTQRMLTELAAEGFLPTPQQLARLHAPIGLDLGADGPGQVALSVVAEILADASHRPATPLRERQGPIHTPATTRTVAVNATEAVPTCR